MRIFVVLHVLSMFVAVALSGGIDILLLRIARTGLPTVATVHHPVAIDRQLELAAAPSRGTT